MAGKKKNLKAVQAAKVRSKKRHRRRKRAIIIVLEVIILALLSGAAYVLAKYDRFQTVSIDKEDIEINEGVEQEGYRTIALFGGDSRDGALEEGTHADTMIVASINNKTKEIRLASVYRDTLLQQEDGSYLKANNAYFCGGPKEAINMLNKNLDLTIEDYVTVDFKALVDTIDLVGGLDIDIKEEEVENINEYLQETADVAGTKTNFITAAGEQHLDGAQAVTYARIRSTAGGDYTRTERQRLVIQKLFEKALDMKLSTLNEIIDTVFPQVSTSFTLKELIALAADVTKYSLGSNTGFPLEKTDMMFGDVGSIVVSIGLTENVQELHEFLYPDETGYTPSETVKAISEEISYLTGVVRGEDGNAIENGTQNYGGDTQYYGDDTQYYGDDTQYYGDDTQYYGDDTQYYGDDTQYYGDDTQYYGGDGQNYGDTGQTGY